MTGWTITNPSRSFIDITLAGITSLQGGGSISSAGLVTLGSGPSINYNSSVELDYAFSSAVNRHGFTDATVFTSTVDGNAYGSFTSHATLAGTHPYDHINAFQSESQVTTSGTLSLLRGLTDIPTVSGGGGVTLRAGVYIYDVTLSGGSTCTQNVGLWVQTLSAGTTNYSIYSVGTQPSFHAGTIQVPTIAGKGPGYVDAVLTLSVANTFWVAISGTLDLTWAAAASGLLTIGTRNTTGSLWINTPSFNSSNDSGFGVNGSYNGVSNVSTINLLAGGVNSVGGFSSKMVLQTTSNTSKVNALTLDSSGNGTLLGGLTIGSTTMLTSSVSLTNGAGAQSPTLTNGPSAGNPTKWIPVNDNGTTRYIPAW